MDKLFIGFFILLVTLLVISCKTKKNVEVKDMGDKTAIDKIAEEKYGKDYLLDYNETKEYVIIKKLKKIRPSDLTPTVKLEIFKLKTMESLFSDTVPRGEVEWEETYVVKVTSFAGIPDPDGNSGKSVYRYHAKNKKKYSGGFFNKKN